MRYRHYFSGLSTVIITITSTEVKTTEMESDGLPRFLSRMKSIPTVTAGVAYHPNPTANVDYYSFVTILGEVLRFYSVPPSND